MSKNDENNMSLRQLLKNISERLINIFQIYFYGIRGVIKLKLKLFKGGVRDISKAKRLCAGDNNNMSYTLGMAKYAMEDYMGAIAELDEAIKINAKDKGAYFSRGLAKRNIRDYKGAIQDFENATEIDAGYHEAYFWCGKIKFQRLDWAGAINDMDKVIEIKPEDAEAFYLRGLCKNNLDDIKGACMDLSKAGEYGHDEAYKRLKDISK